MFFKKGLMIIVAGFFIIVFSAPIYAEMFSVSAGVPLTYSFKDTNLESDGVSGFSGHVKLPILVGLGVEMYDVKIKNSTTKVATQMVDMFYLLPIPVINVSLGLGIGTSLADCTLCNVTYDPGMTTQFYAQLGFPIAVVFDVHLSYHNVNGKIKAKDATKGLTKAQDIDISGKLLAAGVSFSF